MKRVIGGLLVVALIAAAGSSSGAGRVKFRADKARYLEGAIVTFEFRNDAMRPAQMTNPWRVTDGDGQAVAEYWWPEEDLEVAQGETRTWMWDQRGACYGACQNFWEGEPASPGTFTVSVPISDGYSETVTLDDQFDIGGYFTLGFRSHPRASFVVFSNRSEAIEQMRQEASKPPEEKNLIVAGIVRPARSPYNPNWSYIMGPSTIFLGEVFIEVCDASPRYVEQNLKQWRGEQWCPWSSYVAHEGK